MFIYCWINKIILQCTKELPFIRSYALRIDDTACRHLRATLFEISGNSSIRQTGDLLLCRSQSSQSDYHWRHKVHFPSIWRRWSWRWEWWRQHVDMSLVCSSVHWYFHQMAIKGTFYRYDLHKNCYPPDGVSVWN